MLKKNKRLLCRLFLPLSVSWFAFAAFLLLSINRVGQPYFFLHSPLPPLLLTHHSVDAHDHVYFSLHLHSPSSPLLLMHHSAGAHDHVYFFLHLHSPSPPLLLPHQTPVVHCSTCCPPLFDLSPHHTPAALRTRATPQSCCPNCPNLATPCNEKQEPLLMLPSTIA
uniref:Uncharacterized protein n=1 Tax=Dunaliella tertiolecta TaxID=3047 RepID=A0A7S3QXR2_DUNTE